MASPNARPNRPRISIVIPVKDDAEELRHALAALAAQTWVRGLPMGVSMRPFADRSAMRRRFRRGIHTVLIHWPRNIPPVRVLRIALARATGRTFPAAARMSTGSTRARAAGTVESMSDMTPDHPSDPTDAADGAQTHEPAPAADETDTASVDDGDSLRDRSDLQDLPPADATT
ncbi:hypothetical protein [Microbacterium kunmingense]|uniref:hypothetical protein n=1 Tax=Microbacterium kunmingense TaxID=2915939 RepID=UPI003D731E58